MQYKTLHAPVELKVDDTSREVTAYAATFGNRDLVGDVIHPGAFTRTIAERQPAGLIKLFRQHCDLIGIPKVVEEDSKGLLTVSRISRTALGDETLELLLDGALKHFSIGYSTLQSGVEGDPDSEDATRHLYDLDLYEFGPVDFPANPLAEVLGVKAADPTLISLLDLPVRDVVPALKRLVGRGPLTAEEKRLVRGILQDLPTLNARLAQLAGSETEQTGRDLLGDLHGVLASLTLSRLALAGGAALAAPHGP